ncbi:MAG TPA: DUF6519 domain-containing protein [Thermoanaerobaculia bacterium]
MKGDFTRSTFDPQKRYSSVRMQQGRVEVDADWNEQADIATYLRETALADVIGPCGVPKDGGGFEVEVADGGANLTFSAGRLYVDGILCENAVTRRVTEQDEDHPEMALPPEQDGTWFVYLDVWQRHVTALEDPAIREVALGGPDTATRTRTTCQVKMVRVPDGSECPDTPAEWLAAVAAPDGRLRARTRPADFDPNPCVVPPSAGFTRLENQLYRVEVHAGGELGGAGDPPTFKWSRDNGSVVGRWLATTGSDVAVDRLGRDAVLTLEGARWVELTDDLDELGIRPGQLVEVSGTGESSLTVAPAPGAPDLAHNAKVRRWDMPGPGGAVDVAQAPDDDSWTDLESGIQIDFTPGTYRTGDYWSIPARAFVGEHAGDIEWPAPGGVPAALLPAGVEHHYCKLAVVERSGGVFTEVTDCREPFCPLTDLGPGCCTVVVEPGDDVQAAIDSLPPEGGCVCLKTGEHPVRQPIRIARPNVTVHGESPGAVVRGDGTFELLAIGPAGGGAGVEEVAVEGVRFLPAAVQGAGLPAVVTIQGAEDVALRHCAIGEEATFAPGSAVAIGSCERVTVEGCTLAGVVVGVDVFADSTALALRGNRVLGAVSQDAAGDLGSVGIWLRDAFGASWVEGNRVRGFQVGIALNRDLAGLPSSGAGGSVVAGNRVERTAPPGGSDLVAWGIDVAAASCRVASNVLTYGAPSYGGIRINGGATDVRGNRAFSTLSRQAESFESAGLQVGWEGGEIPGLGDRASLVGNRLDGLQTGIRVLRASEPLVRDNRIGGPDDRAALGIQLVEVESGRVVGNRVHAQLGIVLADGGGNRLADNRVEGGFGGILASGEADLAIVGNVVENTTANGILALGLDGATEVSGNRLVSCAHAPAGLVPFSLLLFSDDVSGAVRVESNVVLDSGIAADGEIAIPDGGGIGVMARAVTVHANRVGYENLAALGQGLDAEGRALGLIGLLRLEGRLTDNIPVDVFQPPASALITDNGFHGTGRSALVEVLRWTFTTGQFQVDVGFGEVTFSSNHCLHPHQPSEEVGQRTVALGGRRVVAVGNHVRSVSPLTSFEFDDDARVVYTGNLTTGGTRNADDFPAPESGHNRP